MYLPRHFAESRPEVLTSFVGSHPFGLLITQDVDGRLDANSVPFFLDPDPAGGPGILRAHVAKANALWRTARSDRESVVVFQGPQGYVSPGWYPSKAENGKVVPTWNYVMVEARGSLRAIEDASWLLALVARLTDHHESTRSTPWAVSDAPDEYIAAMLGAIVGLEIVLTSLTGKWKVSQNRPEADRQGVARGLVREHGPAGQALADEVATPGSSAAASISVT